MSGVGETRSTPRGPAPSAGPLRTATTFARTRELATLAWPAVLSYILNNAYRINDQFWIQGLGEKAQSAVGATFFVQVLNFAVVFLAVGGTLALVARAVGALDTARRDAMIRAALLLGTTIGAGLTFSVLPFVGDIVLLLGLESEAAEHGTRYLGHLYPFMTAMTLLPVVDAIFIGRGNTRIPMILQGCSVTLNYILNPLLIYGASAAENSSAPGVGLVSALAGFFGIEGFGIAGAGIATGLSRTAVVVAGLIILQTRLGTRVVVLPRRRSDPTRPRPAEAVRATLGRVGAIMRISTPSSLSIAVYSCAYLLLIRFVLTPLGDEVTAGLGVGFQVFEGLAFPCYLGVSIAASSLVGREIGARREHGVREVVGSARWLARFAGLAFAAIFWFGGPHLVPYFTEDPGVVRETTVYVRTLAFSQYFVAMETVNEKVLLGAGQTRPILWISSLGNLLRVPIGRLLALGGLGLGGGIGAVGVWWAVNLTTLLKSFLFWRRVQSGTWLVDAMREAESEGAGKGVDAGVASGSPSEASAPAQRVDGA